MKGLTPEQLADLQKKTDVYVRKILSTPIPPKVTKKARRQIHSDTRTLYVRSVDGISNAFRRLIRGRRAVVRTGNITTTIEGEE